VPDIAEVFELAADRSRRLRSETQRVDTLKELIENVQLTPGGIRIGITIPLPADFGEPPEDAYQSLGWCGSR
jgi:hypothetical protein